MKKKSKPMKPWLQILMGAGFIIWGAGSLIYQMQPGVIGLKSIPILMLIAGIFNLYMGIKRNNNPEKDALAETQQEANELALSLPVERMSLNPSEETKKSDVYQFLNNSYESWRNGYFDTFSNYYKGAATKDSPEKLTGILLNEASYANFLDRCFKVRIPEKDEIMFTISDGNFMVTNTHLYIASDLKLGELYVMHICEISVYTNKGLWMKSGSIRLKNGNEIRFKLDAVPDENKLRQLQEMLNCKKLIDI